MFCPINNEVRGIMRWSVGLKKPSWLEKSWYFDRFVVISQVVFFATWKANSAPRVATIIAVSFMEVGIVVGVGFVGRSVATRIKPATRLPIARRISGLERVSGVSFIVDIVVRGVFIWT